MTTKAWLLPLLCLGLGTACEGASEPPPTMSFEAFRDQATREPDTGFWIINGDELAESEAELRAAYDRFMGDVAAQTEGLDQIEAPLAVNVIAGRDDIWNSATQRNLTYCIDKRGFGTRYNQVVAAMASATAEWEAEANVNFIHNAALDTKCSDRAATVFNVAAVCRGQYLARAFFPSSSRRARVLNIDCTSFSNIAPWTVNGVLRHELGHALGLRHEHTRPEAGTCFEDNAWRALTEYDANSVMHYPQCSGDNTGDLVLTAFDKAGIAALYPF